MAGPWWVDPDDGLTTNDGLSSDTPWKLIPGQTGASAQTGYGVVANDTINVKNGTTSALQIIPPANGLTYRGYGVASNVLQIRLPDRDVSRTKMTTVVRESGVHEGMWTIDGTGLGVPAIDVQNARTGVTFEDVHVIGDTAGTVNAVRLGTSAAGVQSGITMRRFWVDGASGVGVSCYKINPVLEYFKISGTVSDCWILGATAANSYRGTSTDVVRYFELVEPNVNRAGSFVGDGGDGWQLFHDAGRWEGALTVHDWTLTKNNNIKQGFLICDGLNGVMVKRFHIIGASDSQATGLVTCVRGSVTIQDGYWSEGCLNNAVVRLRSAETALAQLLYTGASLTLRRLVVNAPGGMNHLFDAAESTETLEMDGTVTIEECTVAGPVTGGLSYGAVVSLQGGNTTYGTGFALNLRNNCFDCSGVQVRLPTGTANDADYSIKNNRMQGSSYIGATEYASTAALEAAHNAATGNIDDAPMLGADLSPLEDSPLIEAGTFISYGRDFRGIARWNPPSIGAYEYLRPRNAASARAAASARSAASARTAR